MTLALTGAFTVSNFGDQLYPIVLQPLLRRLGIDEPIKVFALEPGPLADGTTAGSLRDLRVERPRAVLVGGGHIIRIDNATIAKDHLCSPLEKRQALSTRIRSRVYRRRRFPAGPAPWLSPDGWGAAESAVGWLSIGMSDLPASPEILAATRRVEAAWMRTHEGVRQATAAGVPDCHVMAGPDAIFGISSVLEVDQLRSRGDAILRAALGRKSDEVAVIQTAPIWGWTPQRLWQTFRSVTSFPCVFLPMGRYIREDQTLLDAAKLLDWPVLTNLSPIDICAVLSAARCVAATSMHAAIVAACYGRPVVSLGGEKSERAFAACPSPPPVRFADAASVVEALTSASAAEDPPADNTDAVLRSLSTVLHCLRLD